MDLNEVIVLSCRSEKTCSLFQQELELAFSQERNSPDLFVRCLPDAELNIGSGGALVNALLCTSEFLSAKLGFSILQAECLRNRTIIVFLEGRVNWSFDLVSNTFFTHSNEFGHPLPNIVNLYKHIRNLSSRQSQSCVWVVSTDIFLQLNNQSIMDFYSNKQNDLDSESVILYSVLTQKQYINDNGVLKVTKDGYLSKLAFQHSQDFTDCSFGEEDLFPAACGLVSLSTDFALRILQLHSIPPLDGTCYSGIDNGATPYSLSLFFDIIASLCPDWTSASDDFKIREQKHSLVSLTNVTATTDVSSRQNVNHQHDQVQNILRQHLGAAHHRIKVVVLQGDVQFPSDNLLSHVDRLLKQLPTENHNGNVLVNCIYDSTSIQLTACVARNCLFTNAVVTSFQHCLLSGIDNRGLLTISALNRKFEDKFIQQIRCENDRDFIMCRALNDDCCDNSKMMLICEVTDSGAATVVNVDNQKIDLHSVLACVDPKRELEHRKFTFTERINFYFLQKFKATPCSIHTGLHSTTRLLCKNYLILHSPKVLLTFLDSLMPQVASLPVVDITKYLYLMADVLGMMSRGEAGVRSGPANNSRFIPAYTKLRGLDVKESNNFAKEILLALEALQSARDGWINSEPLTLSSSSPSLSLCHTFVRCARHYEGAANILVMRVVQLSSPKVNTINTVDQPPPRLQCVEVTCPARLDLSGGWSDTPPITYEHGGAVVNVSVKINGKHPIGARVQLCKENTSSTIDSFSSSSSSSHILIQLEDQSQLLINSLDELLDYQRPYAVGSLVKAVLALVLDLHSQSFTLQKDAAQSSLTNCLARYFGSNMQLHVHCWSHLPVGSGLGTSSILAGALLQALWTLMNCSFTSLDVVHGVLYVEQMMTTGGGWQDQVGGLLPGVVRLARCNPTVPMQVILSPKDQVNQLMQTNSQCLQELESRLFLVYTGVTRLAKNLLQEVLRQWHCGEDMNVLMENILQNAENCACCLVNNDWEGLGQCIQQYWAQKRQIVPSCAPKLVNELMDKLTPCCLGLTLLGAGGGGFLLGLLRSSQSHCRQKAVQIVDNFNKTRSATLQVFEATCDGNGPNVKVTMFS